MSVARSLPLPLPFSSEETMPARSIASNTFCATNSESCETSPGGGIGLGFELESVSNFGIGGKITVEDVVRVEGVEDARAGDGASVFEDESRGAEVVVWVWATNASSELEERR